MIATAAIISGIVGMTARLAIDAVIRSG